MSTISNDPLNRWSVYRGINDDYVIVKEIKDQFGKVTGYSYVHAIKDDDDLEEFVDLADNNEIDEMFN